MKETFPFLGGETKRYKILLRLKHLCHELYRSRYPKKNWAIITKLILLMAVKSQNQHNKTKISSDEYNNRYSINPIKRITRDLAMDTE